MPDETFYRDNKVTGYKGSEAGKDSKYSDQEAEAERQRYRKTKGFSGIAGVAKMKPADRDAEKSYMESWRKNRGQKAAVAEASTK
jgi:hypothetical protein